MPNDFPRCIGFGDMEGECAYAAMTPGRLYCAPCEDARRTHVNDVLVEAADGRRALPQPLTQTDALIMAALARIGGSWVTQGSLHRQLAERELRDVGINPAELSERMHALDSRGLVEASVSYRLAPGARDFLPPPTPPRVPDALEVGSGAEIRQSPARGARGSDSPPFAPDGAGGEWKPAA